MTEGTDKNAGKTKLTLRKPGQLRLNKTVQTGQVRQNLSPGKSKTVVVETKKTRTFERDAGGEMHVVERVEKLESGSTLAATTKPKGGAAPTLSDTERQRRLAALAGAAQEEERRTREMKEASRRVEESNRKREEEAQRLKEEEEARRRREEEEAAAKAEAELQKAKEQKTGAQVQKDVAEQQAAAQKAHDKTQRDGKGKAAKDKEKDEAGKQTKGSAKPRRDKSRRKGKLTITQALEGDEGMPRTRSLASLRRAREKEKQQAQERRARNEKVVRDVTIPEAITVGELANRMAEQIGDVIKTLMGMGVMATRNQTLDADTAELLAQEFGHRVRRVTEADIEIGLQTGEDEAESLLPRPPVVAVMGHVDHGKTSLLDALRETDVAAGEAGGITQHIGAYQVELSSGAKISFLDTPGHEAFTQMRLRGAQITDLVILVVAADDGIRPQTIEAINHAKAAKTPIIVAINKCDKPNADPNRIKTQLLDHELVAEDMGGDILCVEISALKRQNLDKLEEAVLLQAELLELNANPNRPAEGAVVEARLEQGRGSVATVLIRRGTLRVGDIFVAGSEWGRVRAQLDYRGQQLKEAGPSVPVEIIGLQGTPQAGDEFVVLDSESRAREIAHFRRRKMREAAQAIRAQGAGTLEQMFSQIKAGEATELPLVIKTDVQGSLEAIIAAMDKIGTEEAKVRVLHGAVGGITESDVTLAASTGGVVMGFNVRANPQAREMARRDAVDIRYYSVIYDLIDDAKKVLGGLLAPEERENFLGYAEIREVFTVSKAGKVGGCYITEGMVRRGAKVRLLRDNVVIHEGNLKTLRRFKDDVKEVQNGYECGMAFENYDDLKIGDVIECFEVEEVAREL